MSRFVLVAAGVFALVACGGTTAEVAGPTWTLTELNGSPPIENTTIDLTIEGDSISGTSGCNRYVGSASVGDGEMTLGPELAGTFMNCADDVMAQEQGHFVLARSGRGMARPGRAITDVALEVGWGL